MCNPLITVKIIAISFLHDFSIHFLLKKTKCMLQSKETDQFDTRRVTHIVVVSAFRRKKNRVDFLVKSNQKLIRVETCNGPLCAGKQASEYSTC